MTRYRRSRLSTPGARPGCAMTPHLGRAGNEPTAGVGARSRHQFAREGRSVSSNPLQGGLPRASRLGAFFSAESAVLPSLKGSA